MESEHSHSVGDFHHRAEEVGANLPPLLVAAERVAATVSQGVHGRRRVGQGEAFWQFRRYQPGDSVQGIDWRQSAKSEPVYMRETEWEAAQSVWLWRDESASMDYRSAPTLPKKSERAALLELALAALLIRGGEYVALSGSLRPPSTGRAALLEMAAALSQSLQIDGSLNVSVPPDDALPRRSRIVLFSDFLDPPDNLLRVLKGFIGRGIRGHVVRIIDPAEESLPFEGRVVFTGLEGEDDVLIDGVAQARADYRRVWGDHGAALEDITRSLGWGYVSHHTDQAPEEALLQLYMLMSVAEEI